MNGSRCCRRRRGRPAAVVCTARWTFGSSPSSAAHASLDFRWTRSELFFGSAKPDGSAVTEDEFAAFVESEVTPRFPDGLTLLVGRGQFRNGNTIVRERSFVLILLHPRPNPESSARVEAIRRAYKARFSQHSVLRIDSATTRVCF